MQVLEWSDVSHVIIPQHLFEPDTWKHSRLVFPSYMVRLWSHMHPSSLKSSLLWFFISVPGVGGKKESGVFTQLLAVDDVQNPASKQQLPWHCSCCLCAQIGYAPNPAGQEPAKTVNDSSVE